jgi:serine protease
VFSASGPGIDVVAVGQGIVGAVPRNRCFSFVPCLGGAPYGKADGTSFSTPQVAGLAALLLSQRRDLTPAQLTDIIRGSATAVPDGDRPGWAGAGRINMPAALRMAAGGPPPAGDPCTVARVLDGDTFECAGGRRVRMLQIDAPDVGQCGGDWAKAAQQYIFLTPGRVVYLRYDRLQQEGGFTYAAPIWRGNDGQDYNLSIVMAYVGLARAAQVGAGNVAYFDWARASEAWAAAAQWNMWAPGKTFNGGC